METPNTDMLRGRVDIFVLKALSENDGYGYDILNYIHSKTEGHYEMKQSSIYSVLKRLEKQGYVSSYTGEESNGAKRRYYSLTDSGKSLLENEENEWAYTRTLLDNLVSNREFDLKSDTPPFRPSDLRPMTKRSVQSYGDFDESNSPKSSPTPSNVNEETVVASADNIAPVKVDNLSVKIADATVDQNITQNFIPDPVEDDLPISEPIKTEEAENHTKKLSNNELNEFLLKYTAKSEVIPTETTDKNVAAASISDNDFSVKDNYRDFFGSLFANQTKRRETPASAHEQLDEIDCTHINDLRIKLNDEGIRLKSYEPTTAHKGLLQYVLVNKLLRDTVILSYLFLVVMLLVVGLCKPLAVSLHATLIIGGICLVFPIAALLICLNNPDKKKKDNINIKIILSISGIIYLAFFIINLIVSLIVPNGLSLNSPATYAPCIICLVIPFFGGLLSLLYKTHNYHLKTK